MMIIEQHCMKPLPLMTRWAFSTTGRESSRFCHSCRRARPPPPRAASRAISWRAKAKTYIQLLYPTSGRPAARRGVTFICASINRATLGAVPSTHGIAGQPKSKTWAINLGTKSGQQFGPVIEARNTRWSERPVAGRPRQCAASPQG